MKILQKRKGASVISIAIELIFFAAIGLTALIMLATSATTGLSSTNAFLAVGFVSLVAILGVAVSFLKKSGISVGI